MHKLQRWRQGDNSVASRGANATHIFVVPRRNRYFFAIFLYRQPPAAQVLLRMLDQYLWQRTDWLTAVQRRTAVRVGRDPTDY